MRWRPSRSCASSGLATGIYPLLDVVVERADQPFVNAALQDTDRRVGEGKPVAPSFLLACVLWADVRDGWAQRIEGRHGQRAQAAFPALQDAIDDVFNARIGDVSGRGKLAADMREIWMMQPRFDKRSGATPYSLVEQARFRAAFDFMRLRADVGEVSEAIAEWWQEFSTADDVRRQDLLDQVRDEQQKKNPPARARARAGRPDGRRGPAQRCRGRGRAAARWRGRHRAAQAPPPAQAPHAAAKPAASSGRMTARAYVAIGANLGDARATVAQAMDDLDTLPGTRVVARSSLYRSAPVDASGPGLHQRRRRARYRAGRRRRCWPNCSASSAARAASAPIAMHRAPSISTCCATATRRWTRRR